MFFQKKGYNVIADYNGDWFQVPQKPCPDIYLVDINLADKNGFDLCKIIKKDCKHAQVVLMSANIHLETMAAECHADGFIHKPFDLDKLYVLVDGVLA